MEDQAERYFNEGVNFANNGRHAEAIDSYDKAIAIEPYYVEALNFRGIALGELEQYSEAVDSYDLALDIEPNFSDAWNFRGDALGELGRYAEALTSYDKAIAIDRNDAMAWYSRAVALDKLGRHAEAVASNDMAIKLDPQNELAFAKKKELLTIIHNKELVGKNETRPLIIYNISGDAHIGDKTQTDIKNSLIQRSNFGTEIPIEKKGCPRCQKKIEGNEKFCSECGQNLRE